MTPTTVLIDEVPRCVVRPTDQKALNRFLRNSKTYLLAGKADGAVMRLWRFVIAGGMTWEDATDEVRTFVAACDLGSGPIKLLARALRD